MSALRDRSRDFGCGDDSAERSAVADPFRHRHDVRHDALSLKSPVVRAGASEPRLDFIGDTYAAGRVHMFVSML